MTRIKKMSSSTVSNHASQATKVHQSFEHRLPYRCSSFLPLMFLHIEMAFAVQKSGLRHPLDPSSPSSMPRVPMPQVRTQIPHLLSGLQCSWFSTKADFYEALESFIRSRCSAKQFDVKTDGTHKQIDISQSLRGHLRWERLALCHSLHNSVPVLLVSLAPNILTPLHSLDSYDETLLLIRTCA